MPVLLFMRLVDDVGPAGRRRSYASGRKFPAFDQRFDLSPGYYGGFQKSGCYLNYPQGSAKIIPDFENNSSELRKLDDFIRQVFRDSLIYVDSIRLSGYCSIEGSYGVNERLAKTRVMGFKNYLDNEYDLSQRYPIRVNWVAEDWDELLKLVEDSDMPKRDEVIYLIENVGVFQGREKRLMDLDNGVSLQIYVQTFLFRDCAVWKLP